MNIKLTISYDGSKFNGSAKQPKEITVQGELEKALATLGITGKTVFSGRTDKDVHSTNQVVSFVLPAFWEDENKLKIAIDRLVGDFIYVKRIEKVPNDFHARFSAISREYRYVVSTERTNPFTHNYLYHHENTKLEIMQEASKVLIGKHNFLYFSKVGSEPKSTIREIYEIKIYEYKKCIIFKFKANSYLRSQIRMMVDFLLKISDGKQTIDNLKKQLLLEGVFSKTLAPATGLYLTKINYNTSNKGKKWQI